MRTVRASLFLFLIPGALGLTCHGQSRPDLDAGRLRMGTFHYRDHIDGSSDGESAIRIERLAAGTRYAFSNVVSGTLSQQWRTLSLADFTPLSAELTFGSSASAAKAFSLSYKAGHVTGFFVPDPRAGDAEKHPVNVAVALDTVDQRIDWAAVMSFKEYKPSEQLFFHVYDPKAGNSKVEATVESHETIHVDAGSFDVFRIVYRIAKSGWTERFEVFVHASTPRFLVKEVFPDGLVSELVSMEP